jgi:hypothetical protein
LVIFTAKCFDLEGVLVKHQPYDDALGSKHVAVKITKNTFVLRYLLINKKQEFKGYN